MSRYWIVAGGLVAFFLAGFLLAEALGVPWLTTSPQLSADTGPGAAVLAVGLLVADALLPVPSSLVMIALGGLYGVWLGAALALVGRIGMALLGFAVGRRGGPLLARLVPESAQARGAQLVRRWGAAAIVVTRPVPLVGETVVVMAGAGGMTWRRATVAAIVGSVPEAVLYAWAGAGASRLADGIVVWVALLALAVAVWTIGLLADRRLAAVSEPAVADS